MGPIPCSVAIVTGCESRIPGEEWDLKIKSLNERSSTAYYDIPVKNERELH